MVTEWLREDVPSFDYGGYVVGDKMETAHLLGKSPVRTRPPFLSLFLSFPPSWALSMNYKGTDGQMPVNDVLSVHVPAMRAMTNAVMSAMFFPQ